jgi:uncharacterized cupredoxin-like copper-binding protein
MVEGEGPRRAAPELRVGDVEVDLKAGTYTLYCPVGTHEQAGMVAELTVR